MKRKADEIVELVSGALYAVSWRMESYSVHCTVAASNDTGRVSWLLMKRASSRAGVFDASDTAECGPLAAGTQL